MTRHEGKVYGHSKGKRPGEKQYYRPIYSASCWDEFVKVNSVGTIAQVCCGGSFLGSARVDLDPEAPAVNILADQARLPFKDDSFDTVACDPIYGLLNADRVHLQRELARVARRRILFKATWVPRATGWRLQEPVMGILSHTCANVAVMAVLIPKDEDQMDLWPRPVV